MGLRVIVLSIMLIIIAGCSVTYNQIDKPADGYNAIRIKETFEVNDHAINTYIFEEGRIFVSDFSYKGKPLHCGDIGLNNENNLEYVCVEIIGDDTIILSPGSGIKEVQRNIPENSFETMKVPYQSFDY